MAEKTGLQGVAVQSISPIEHLRNEMRLRGWSAVELARRIGVHSQTIYNITSGNRPISAKLALKLEKQFNRPAEFWLSYNTGEMASSKEVETSINTANWTGQWTIKDHAVAIKKLTPLALVEIDNILERVEILRLNDEETQKSLITLKQLQSSLGLIIDSIEQEINRSIISEIARKHQAFVDTIKLGSKVFVVAPAFTLGLTQIISLITGVPIDSTLVSSVWAGLVAADIAGPMLGKGNSLPPR